MLVRFAREIGRRVSLRRYWGRSEDSRCPGNLGRSMGYHNGHHFLRDVPYISPDGWKRTEDEEAEKACWPAGRVPLDDPRWATIVCDGCGERAPDSAERQHFTERLYDTPSGELDPGSLYWTQY